MSTRLAVDVILSLLHLFTMSGSKVTRGSLKECPIFGKPQELYRYTLPTVENTLKYFLFVQHTLTEKNVNRNCVNSEAVTIVADALEEIWNRASIPIVSKKKNNIFNKRIH